MVLERCVEWPVNPIEMQLSGQGLIQCRLRELMIVWKVEPLGIGRVLVEYIKATAQCVDIVFPIRGRRHYFEPLDVRAIKREVHPHAIQIADLVRIGAKVVPTQGLGRIPICGLALMHAVVVGCRARRRFAQSIAAIPVVATGPPVPKVHRAACAVDDVSYAAFVVHPLKRRRDNNIRQWKSVWAYLVKPRIGRRRRRRRGRRWTVRWARQRRQRWMAARQELRVEDKLRWLQKGEAIVVLVSRLQHAQAVGDDGCVSQINGVSFGDFAILNGGRKVARQPVWPQSVHLPLDRVVFGPLDIKETTVISGPNIPVSKPPAE